MSEYSRIYCDMDGVLCDFEKNIKNNVGITVQKWMQIPKHERWDPVIAKPSPKSVSAVIFLSAILSP